MESEATVFVVDDDDAVRDSLKLLLESSGFKTATFGSAGDFLDQVAAGRQGACLLLDVRMPDMDGLALLHRLAERQVKIPVIVMTGHGDVPIAVKAMKEGAVDFIEKPFSDQVMLDGVRRALEIGLAARRHEQDAVAARERLQLLTAREREVLEEMVAGNPNKLIAYELGISPRTVEIHRARVMEKMQAKSLSELVRIALAGGVEPASRPRRRP